MIYGKRNGGGEHGTVFTKKEVADFILDLSDLNDKSSFLIKRTLDPSVGEGIFILRLIDRIIKAFHDNANNIKQALQNITAVEMDKAKCMIFRKNVSQLLEKYSLEKNLVDNITLINSDYLLANTGKYDVIIGNPPYVRYDNIPISKIDAYRSLYSCFKNRCDLYVPFFEKGLKSLNSNGILTFICSDRWLNNQYGHMLRKIIINNFYFKDIIKIDGFNAFEEDVIAYPAIFSIKNCKPDQTHYMKAKDLNDLELKSYILNAKRINFDNDGFIIHTKDAKGCITIEDQGFKIGIGVATGLDKVFVIKKINLEIEEEVLVPLITRKDIKNGQIIWNDRYVINPFLGSTTSLINLDNYPKLKQYFINNENELKKRHVARKDNNKWYKTIDRIYPELVKIPKLLLPDISCSNIILFDEGNYYPHHNFYYIIGNSRQDLLALRSILSTDFVKKQISEKGIMMNGGALRWQAQTLRKLKIPNILKLSNKQKDLLIELYNNDDYSKLEKETFNLANNA